MEMCYDGALVMPNSYAVMTEDEMTYVEGGAKYWGFTAPIAFLIDVGIAVLGGFNISAIGNLTSLAIKNLIQKNWSTIGKRVLEGISAAAASVLSTLIGSVNLPMGVITSATSIGGLVAMFIDATDKNLDGKFVFYT